MPQERRPLRCSDAQHGNATRDLLAIDSMFERFPFGGFPSGSYVMRPSAHLAPKQVEGVRDFGRYMAVPGLISIIRESVFMELRHDVSQDIPFWESKHHIEKPLLAEGDGPIGIYRRWSQQFYRPNSES